jgi:hypothetical protein
MFSRSRPCSSREATAVVVMNISGADPLGMLRTYGKHVLAILREA